VVAGGGEGRQNLTGSWLVGCGKTLQRDWKMIGGGVGVLTLPGGRGGGGCWWWEMSTLNLSDSGTMRINELCHDCW
jgi:hypothetical protein